MKRTPGKGALPGLSLVLFLILNSFRAPIQLKGKGTGQPPFGGEHLTPARQVQA